MMSGKQTQKSDNAPVSSGLEHASGDALLDCLVRLSAYYGRARSAGAITAGLAYDEKGMGPDLFCEAAGKMALKTKVRKISSLQKIPAAVMPVVLILKNKKACILFEAGDGKAKIYRPETGTEQVVKSEDLSRLYEGYAIYVHPQPDFADPEAPQAKESGRHWFWGAVRENRGIYGRVLLAAALVNLFGLTSSLYIMNVYDRVIPNSAVETGWVLAIGALTVYVFDFIMRSLRGYFIDLAGRRIDVVATRRIYDHLLDMKLAGRPPSSGAFANMLREFDSVRDFITSATLTALVDLPFTLFFLFVIYLLGGPIAFMIACLIVIVIGAGMALQYPLKTIVARSVHAAEAKHGLLVETIHGLETVKAIGADGRMRARYGAHVGESARHAQDARFVSGLGVNIATFFQQSATIIIVLMGMYLVQDNEMSMGQLIACVILGGRAMAPIGQVANLLTRYHQSRTALKTLNNIMAQPEERPAGKRFLHRPDLTGKVSFDKVGFSYPGSDQKILDDVSFSIQAGEKVGIIGRIGSGKSTMARLMLGLYDPAQGAILADDTDYRQIDPADLRRNIAYIAQDVVLFRGSVRENIAIGKPQATEEEILEAAKTAGVHEFIARHPMGYDAPVGESGGGLSGGQRQAIALARAMLMTPNIIVCDEPTNAMDVQAEEAFTRHIQEQAKGRTFILITHRQHLLKLVERLILVDRGRVILDGPRDKVLETLAAGKVQVPKDS